MFISGCGPAITPTPTSAPTLTSVPTLVPTQTPIPTPTLIPFSELDLTTINIQTADVFEGFQFESKSNVGIGGFYEQHKNDITNFHHIDYKRLPNYDSIGCFLYVCKDESLAKQAFVYSKSPLIGDQKIGDAYNMVVETDKSFGTVNIQLSWIYKEMTGYMYYIGLPEGTTEETVTKVARIAQNIQARLESIQQ